MARVSVNCHAECFIAGRKKPLISARRLKSTPRGEDTLLFEGLVVLTDNSGYQFSGRFWQLGFPISALPDHRQQTEKTASITSFRPFEHCSPAAGCTR